MKPTVYIHAGTHKTASSSLQNLLFDNRDRLNELGWYYPLSGLVKQKKLGVRHYFLQYQLIKNKDFSHWDELRKELSESESKKIIISHENFLSPYINPEIIKNMLPEYNIKMIAYFRHPIDYIESCYREWIQNVGPYDKDIITFYEWRKPYLNYKKLVEKWIHAIGDKNVIVRVFDRACLNNGVIEKDFIENIGLDNFNFGKRVNYNTSLNSNQILMILLKKRNLSSDSYIKYLEDLLENVYKNGYTDQRIINEDIVDEVLREHQKDFQYILSKVKCDKIIESKFMKLEYNALFDKIEKETNKKVGGQVITLY